MRHFLTPFLCLLSALLAGCPSAPPAAEAEAEPIPELTVLHSAELLSGLVRFFALSEDGNTFVAGSEYDGVGLYRTSDYALLERYYECEPPKDGAATCNTKADTYGVGYIDANTWYFAASVRDDKKNPGELNMRLYIRALQPPQEIVTLNGWGVPVIANKNHILSGGKLIDWHAGKGSPVIN